MKTRKNLRFYLLIICLISSIQMWASDFEVDGIYYNYIPNTEDVEVTYNWYGRYKGDIEIPNTVTYAEKTYNVTRIGEGAFANSVYLFSVILPDSITEIMAQAFSGCQLLDSVLLSNNVTRIESNAFKNCEALRSITLSNKLEHLDNNVFSGCHNLNSIEIPASTTVIGESVFVGCLNLVSINVDADNTQYLSEDGILYNKDKTTLICFPANKENTAFSIPNTIKEIAHSAFANCVKLTSIEIPSSVEIIGVSAFKNCNALEIVEVKWDNPSDVAFIDLPFDFENSMLLIVPVGTKNLYINTPIWSSFQRIVEKGEDPDFEIIDGILIKYYGVGGDVIIPEDVRVIGNYAFSNYENLISVAFPESLTEIGVMAFSNCTSLESIDFPKSLTHIGDYAFSNCISLESIHLPESLTKIGEGAFSQCSAIGSINFPESLTHIGDYAFSNCISLESIFFPKSITNIGSGAFLGCFKLRTVEVEWDIPFLVTYTVHPFEYINLHFCKLIVPKGTRNAYRRTDVWGDFIAVIEKRDVGITDISTSFNVYLSNNMLYVNSAIAETVSIYSMDGVHLYSLKKEAGEISYQLNTLFDKLLIVTGSSGWSRKINK